MGKIGFCFSLVLLIVSFLILIPFSYAEIPEYSVTWINQFDTASDLPDCNIDANETVSWLGSRGYDNFFVWGDYDAWKIDFDIYNSGYEGLDEADFHLHSGHGGWGYILLADGTHVNASDCSGHWDWDSEWVFFYTCLTLADHANWAKAMTTATHALFGFTSISYGTYGALMDGYFRRAIQWGWIRLMEEMGEFRQKYENELKEKIDLQKEYTKRIKELEENTTMLEKKMKETKNLFFDKDYETKQFKTKIDEVKETIELIKKKIKRIDDLLTT